MNKPTEQTGEIKRPSRRARLLAVFLSFGVTLAAVEGGLRLAGYGQRTAFDPDERYGYLMRPDQTVWSHGLPVRINNRGLRGPDVAPVAQPDVKRVVFVGDSVTYGGGRIAGADLFCRISASLAARDRTPWEAVNLSAPGWSPQNWIAYIETHGLLDADAVVLILPACDLDRPFATMAMHGFSSDPPVLRLQALWARAAALLKDPDPYAGSDPVRARARNVEAVRSLQARCRAAGIPCLVVFLPSRTMPGPAAAWHPFEALVPDALDLREVLHGGAHFFDAIHLNAQGHRRVGEAIYAARARLAPVAP